MGSMKKETRGGRGAEGASSEFLGYVHPGDVLAEEFLEPLGVSQARLARDINISARRVNELCQRKRGITADTALRLASYFGTSAAFWLNLQTQYEIEKLERERGAEIRAGIRERPGADEAA